jgi:hypothetical protein
MTKRELETQVAALRAEVAGLRAEVQRQEFLRLGHVCVLPAGPQCTCGTSLRCMRHFPSDFHGISISPPNLRTNVCAGAPTTVSLTTTWNFGFQGSSPLTNDW